VARYRHFVWDRWTKIYSVHFAMLLFMIPLQIMSRTWVGLARRSVPFVVGAVFLADHASHFLPISERPLVEHKLRVAPLPRPAPMANAFLFDDTSALAAAVIRYGLRLRFGPVSCTWTT
jgi:hypothetical protein